MRSARRVLLRSASAVGNLSSGCATHLNQRSGTRAVTFLAQAELRRFRTHSLRRLRPNWAGRARWTSAPMCFNETRGPIWTDLGPSSTKSPARVGPGSAENMTLEVDARNRPKLGPESAEFDPAKLWPRR